MRSGGIRSVCSEWVTRFYFYFIIFLSIFPNLRGDLGVHMSFMLLSLGTLLIIFTGVATYEVER